MIPYVFRTICQFSTLWKSSTRVHICNWDPRNKSSYWLIMHSIQNDISSHINQIKWVTIFYLCHREWWSASPTAFRVGAFQWRLQLSSRQNITANQEYSSNTGKPQIQLEMLHFTEHRRYGSHLKVDQSDRKSSMRNRYPRYKLPLGLSRNMDE